MPTFTDKVATLHTIRTGPGSVLLDLTGDSDGASTVTLLPDGKILVGGYSYYPIAGYSGSPGDESRASRGDYSLVRLNADGSLDTTFSQGGVDLVPASVDSESDTDLVMAVQADGKVVSGQSGRGGFTVQRFNTDGSLDTTFGRAGAITVDTPSGFDQGVALKVNSDGTLYLSLRGATTATVTQFDSNGNLVKAFGEDGQLTLSPQGEEYVNGTISTSLQPDGSVLLGSWLYERLEDANGNPISGLVDPPYAIERLKADGTPDTRFGNNGVVYIDKALIDNYYAELTVQPDGKILLVGDSNRSHTANILRLNADGSMDTGFGKGGVVSFEVTPNGSNTPNSVVVQTDGKILVVGSSSLYTSNSDFGIIRLNPDGSLDSSFGSRDGQQHVDGSSNPDFLRGGDFAEIIRGHAGDDLLQGNGGRDVLAGGNGADIFRFTTISDSYRTQTETSSDRILDFDPSQDRIDLIALGFTGIGDGHKGTLAIQANAEGTRTYLKSFDADATGHRFELAFDGDLASQLNSTNLVFTPPTVEGTSGRDLITGAALSEIIRGGAGNDDINGGIGADIIWGGEGADRLNGGDPAEANLYTPTYQNEDTFLYTSVNDSYRTATQSFADVIVDFADRSDKIDVSALGYTGFGDGTGTTLKVVYNYQVDRTYIKDVEPDAQGHRFELVLTGNWQDELDNSNMIFASPAAEVTLVGVADASHDHLQG
jgi:serralysin